MRNRYLWESFFKYLGGAVNVISLALDFLGKCPKFPWQIIAIAGTIIFIVASTIETNSLKKNLFDQFPNIKYVGHYEEPTGKGLTAEDMDIALEFSNYPYTDNKKYLSGEAKDVIAEISYFDENIDAIYLGLPGIWWPKRFDEPKDVYDIERLGATNLKPNKTKKKLHVIKYIREVNINDFFAVENTPEYYKNFPYNHRRYKLNTKHLLIFIELFGNKMCDNKYYLELCLDDDVVSVKEIKDRKICRKINAIMKKQAKK